MKNNVMKVRKAQAALEYFIIVALALFLMGPILIYANEALSSSQDELKISTAKNAVERVAESAEWVYIQGSPAKTTITVFIPDNINESAIFPHTVQLKLSTTSGPVDIYKDTVAFLNGSLPNVTGYHQIKIEAISNYVNISQAKFA